MLYYLYNIYYHIKILLTRLLFYKCKVKKLNCTPCQGHFFILLKGMYVCLCSHLQFPSMDNFQLLYIHNTHLAIASLNAIDNVHYYNNRYNRVSISRMFGLIYNTFGIKGASHLGRHLFVSKLVNAGVNICLVQKLAAP